MEAHRRRRSGWTLLILGAALALSACGGDDSTPEGTDLPQSTVEGTDESDASVSEADRSNPGVELSEGWTLAEGQDWAIGLPEGWFNADRLLSDEEAMAELVSAAGDVAGEDLSAFVQDSIAAVDFMAVNADELTVDFATNINMVIAPRGPMDEPEVSLATADEAMDAVGGDVTATDEYDVGGLPVVEITFDLVMGSNEHSGIQSQVFAKDHLYVVTYSALEPDPELWRSIISTFTLLE